MIIPAIDLINHQVVRLYQGDYQQKTQYQVTPLERLSHYAEQGGKLLHIVDLDGAKDPSKRQFSTIKQLIDANLLPLQVGGGVRTEQDVEQLLALGVSRVVIGSTAIKQPELVSQWFTRFGADKLVLALDININEKGEKLLPTQGWQQASNITLEALLERYLAVGVKHVLCTDISKDGTLSGSNCALYQELTTQYSSIEWQASGGIGSLNDISQVKQSGAQHLILGRALLEQKFTLQEAIACWQNG